MITGYLFLMFGTAALGGFFSKRLGYLSAMAASIVFLALEFRPDEYLSYFALISSIVWIFVSAYSFSYGEKFGRWLSSLLPLMMMGMALVLTSSNYIVLIAGWEIMSLPAYLIIAINGREYSPAFIFLTFSEFSTVLIIAGVAYAFFLTGSLSIGAVPSYMPLLLISLGSLIKMGMTPFMISEWLPIAHGNAPANASAVLSATMTLMGVYLIMRLTLLSPDAFYLGIFFLSVGALSIIYSAIYAYVSENMKMLAGFSTIENNAAILTAIGLYTIASSSTLQAFIAATIIIFSLSHSLSKTGLFMSIGNLPGEFFGESSEPTSYLQRIGTVLSTASLSGLFPTIGGLATWMLLESFFMEAYFGGPGGIIAMIVGSIIALGEGLATGAMMKLLSFGNLFGKAASREYDLGSVVLTALGIFLVLTFAFSITLVPSEFISGMPSILIFNGFLLTSSFNGTVFGLVSPVYVVSLVSGFSLAAYAVFGKPKLRVAPAWNSGLGATERYTSFGYSNNVRLMLRRILKTNLEGQTSTVTVIDLFWLLMTDIGKGYRNMCRFITYRFMNSSIGWYMIYMIVAFMTILVVSVRLY